MWCRLGQSALRIAALVGLLAPGRYPGDNSCEEGQQYAQLRLVVLQTRSRHADAVHVAELRFERLGHRLRCDAAPQQGNSPPGMEMKMALDNDLSTSWLDFSPIGAAVVAECPEPIDAYTLATAVGPPERDPTSWRLEGRTTRRGPWEVLHESTSMHAGGEAAVPLARGAYLPRIRLRACPSMEILVVSDGVEDRAEGHQVRQNLTDPAHGWAGQEGPSEAPTVIDLLSIPKPAICQRPAGWCDDPRTMYYDMRDCDADGAPDHFCSSHAATGESGFIASADDCRSTWAKGAPQCAGRRKAFLSHSNVGSGRGSDSRKSTDAYEANVLRWVADAAVDVVFPHLRSTEREQRVPRDWVVAEVVWFRDHTFHGPDVAVFLAVSAGRCLGIVHGWEPSATRVTWCPETHRCSMKRLGEAMPPVSEAGSWAAALEPLDESDLKENKAVLPALRCEWQRGNVFFGRNLAEYAIDNHEALPRSELLRHCVERASSAHPYANSLNYWPLTGRCVVKDPQHAVSLKRHASAWACDLATRRWPDSTSQLVCDASLSLSLLESVRCALTLRQRGERVAVDVIGVNVTSKTGDIVLAGQEGLQSRVTFVYSATSLARVANVAVILFGEMLPLVLQPSFSHAAPDGSSSLACDSTGAVVGGAPLACHLYLRREQHPLEVPLEVVHVTSSTGWVQVKTTCRQVDHITFAYAANSFAPHANIHVRILGEELLLIQPLALAHRLGMGAGYLEIAKSLLHRGRIQDSLGTLAGGLRRGRGEQIARLGVGVRLAEATEAEALRARLLLLTGRWDVVRAFLARAGYLSRAGSEASGTEAGARRLFLASLTAAVEAGESATNQALALLAGGSFRAAIGHFSAALEVARESEQLHLWRAECALRARDYRTLRIDVSIVLGRINPFSVNALWLMGLALVRILGHLGAGLHNLELCLRWAFGHVACAAATRATRALKRHWDGMRDAVSKSDWPTTIHEADQLLEADGEADYFVLRARRALCHAHRELNKPLRALEACRFATSGNLADVEGLEDEEREVRESFLDYAWVLIQLQDWVQALAALDVARRLVGDSDKRADEMREEVKRLQGENAKFDYYEILGLARDATLDMIKKAYRRLALLWHPDKNLDSPEEAEEMFRKISEAYTALSDMDIRERYNAGEDVRREANRRSEERRKFKVDPRTFSDPDPETGMRSANASWTDPETNETHTVNVTIEPKFRHTGAPPPPAPLPPPRRHCCLPQPGP